MSNLTIHDITSELSKIVRTLADLNWGYDIQKDTAVSEYSFDNAAKVIDLLDGNLHILTHELSTDIAFRLQQIGVALRYADFRQKYSRWSSEELEEVVDGTSAIRVVRSYLAKHCISDTDDKQRINQEVRAIKIEWNKLFHNKNYSKIMSELGS